MNLDEQLAGRLAELEAADLRRALPAARTAGLVNFGSNDYLGLSRHPALVAAAQEALARDGTGAGAARLLCAAGNAEVGALEEALAQWKGTEAALVFGSGYAAALGTIPALVGPGDTVILDKLAHASLIDAARLSGATVRTFPHNRLERLESILKQTAARGGQRMIVTESVFSMDGDDAPLRELVLLKERHGASLLVDEAHATGLRGPEGAGLIAELALTTRVEIILATQSKALGNVGGMICGSRHLVDWLLNRARAFVFSTALPPSVVAASHAAVTLLQSAEGAKLREDLRSNIEYFRERLPLNWRERAPSAGAIQPLLCGPAGAALHLSRALAAHGLYVPAIRFPTVPRHGARLRVTLSAAHTKDEIGRLLEALLACADELGGIDPHAPLT